MHPLEELIEASLGVLTQPLRDMGVVEVSAYGGEMRDAESLAMLENRLPVVYVMPLIDYEWSNRYYKTTGTIGVIAAARMTHASAGTPSVFEILTKTKELFSMQVVAAGWEKFILQAEKPFASRPQFGLAAYVQEYQTRKVMG